MRVLVVDDDEAVRRALTHALHQARALPGSGLGLAIVRRIADIRGTVEAIPLQQGVRSRISIPEIVVDQPTVNRPRHAADPAIPAPATSRR